MRYETINPTSGKREETYPVADDAGIDQALTRSVAAFTDWRRTPVEERAAILRQAGEALEAEAGDLGALMAREMGKPLAEGLGEAKKCAWACRFYADHAAEFLADSAREADDARAHVRHDPLGPILAIMPWNFPFWQFFRFAAPALAAGNTILLKHAPNTPACALKIESLLLGCGLPAGVVQNLFLTNEQAARVIADPRLQGVTLTGSTRAGKQVAAVAGAHLKTMVMELGGSDPFVVFADADLEGAVAAGIASRCLNNGQSCIAAKRFLVEHSLFDRFRDAYVEGMKARVMGDPMLESVSLGPLARQDLRDGLADQVQKSLNAGALALCGGTSTDRAGWFYPATVLVNPAPGSPAANEELFGPVATLVPFRDEAEATAMANATEYGLGASLWTRDEDRVRRLLPEIEAGAVFVNGMVKSDPRLPFGGIKESGFGRELGREGMMEFVNLKTVWIG